MDFKEVTSAASDLAQVVAIAVGGGWAYLKFIRGRTFRRRGELRVDADLLTLNDGRAVVARIAFTNTGLSRIRFQERKLKGVFIYALEESSWHPDGEDAIDWGEREKDDRNVMRSPALRDHEWVEPGESIHDEILLPVGCGGDLPLAYQVVARVTTPERRWIFWEAAPRWTARTVLPVRLQLRGTSSEQAMNAPGAPGGPREA